MHSLNMLSAYDALELKLGQKFISSQFSVTRKRNFS